MTLFTTSDLKAKRNDIEHLDTAKVRTLGERNAQQYLKMASRGQDAVANGGIHRLCR